MRSALYPFSGKGKNIKAKRYNRSGKSQARAFFVLLPHKISAMSFVPTEEKTNGY